MLIEIKSTAFRQNTISFNKGLNVILGDEKASNSIGKSTMLKVIDFAFGGESYSKDLDIIKNVGHHNIDFSFEFSEIVYVFSRSTQNPNIVKVHISKNIQNEETWTLEKFKIFLFNHYFSNEMKLTFRGYVQLFSRIYGNTNMDELHPLNSFPSEKGIDIIMKLIKMFNRFDKIESQQKTFLEIKEKLDILKKAAKSELLAISKNAKDYKLTEKKIFELEANINIVKTQLETKTLDLSVEQYQMIENFKYTLSKIQTIKQKLTSEIQKLYAQEISNNTFLDDDKEHLQKLFPSINIKEIENINRFHTQIFAILKNEIKRCIKEKENKIKDLEAREIEEIKSIKETISIKDSHKIAVDRLIDYQKQIDKLLSEKGCYEQQKTLEDDKKSANLLLNQMLESDLNDIQQNINENIRNKNDFLFDKKKHSPILMLKTNSYKYSSEDDQGTGTQYKNLILLDLALLELTQLPILIHDSVLFKNIEYETMDKIIELYMSYQDKQIFITTDAIHNYKDNIKAYIKINTVLELSKNGLELYGKSWNSDKNKLTE